MRYVVDTIYNKSTNRYELNLAEVSQLIEVRELNSEVKETVLFTLKSTMSNLTKDRQEFINNLQPNDIELKINHMYERDVERDV